jgi:hypothetical protein
MAQKVRTAITHYRFIFGRQPVRIQAELLAVLTDLKWTDNCEVNASPSRTSIRLKYSLSPDEPPNFTNHFLSLTSIYLQFIMPDVFQPHGSVLSGSMFGSTLHVEMCRPKKL